MPGRRLGSDGPGYTVKGIVEYHSTNAARVHKHIRLLTAAGVDVATILPSKGLPSSIIDHPHARIPSSKTYSILNDLSLKAGIPDLGFLGALNQTFETIEEPYRSQFAECLNVYQALRLYLSLIPRVNPTRRGKLVVGPNTASFLVYADTEDRSSAWLNYSDWGNILNVAILIKHGAGDDFRFQSIELMSDWPAPDSFVRHFDCLLMRAGPAVRLTFPKQLLFKPYPRVKTKVRSRPLEEAYEQGDATFPKVVGETLKTFISEYDLRIEEAAEIFDTTPRTLQRHLAKHRTSFSDILLDVKLKFASELLRDLSISIADIATTLGYAEQSSFSRMFSSKTGVTPGAYRRATYGGN